MTSSAAAIELRGITRRFGSLVALSGIDLVIRRGEFFSLLGPSGCGKTTLLRLIAGLDLPDSGTLYISGRDAAATPAHRRPVNTVFQSYALFPHLGVRDNVAFGLRVNNVPASEIERRVGEVMEMVQITDLASRRPAHLSGGQKQRVALARAIVNEPEVLLLDEPLGALDLKFRKQLQLDLHALQRRLGITFVHVTHDQDEALVMSDRIALMNAGRIEQLGAGADLYERPRTRFVAEFLGSCTLFEGTVSHVAAGVMSLETRMGRLVARDSTGTRKTGDHCTLAVRPEKVLLGAAPDAVNSFAARVAGVVYSGSETGYVLRCENVLVKARQLNARPDHERFGADQKVMIRIEPDALVVLED
jgi:spermidine/putrescine transport system ATP-binding protein